MVHESCVAINSAKNIDSCCVSYGRWVKSRGDHIGSRGAAVCVRPHGFGTYKPLNPQLSQRVWIPTGWISCLRRWNYA